MRGQSNIDCAKVESAATLNMTSFLLSSAGTQQVLLVTDGVNTTST
jgi:hypothetical protein